MALKINIIAAVAENNAIGKNNKLLWKLPVDMKFFKEKTDGHIVVMGRKTFESIPDKFKPLPNRRNIVITRSDGWDYTGVLPYTSPKEAIDSMNILFDSDDCEIFITGGAQIYEHFIPLADKMYITHVNANPDGDVFFPEWNKDEWDIKSQRSYNNLEKHDHDFNIVEYERKN